MNSHLWCKCIGTSQRVLYDQTYLQGMSQCLEIWRVFFAEIIVINNSSFLLLDPSEVDWWDAMLSDFVYYCTPNFHYYVIRLNGIHHLSITNENNEVIEIVQQPQLMDFQVISLWINFFRENQINHSLNVMFNWFEYIFSWLQLFFYSHLTLCIFFPSF